MFEMRNTQFNGIFGLGTALNAEDGELEYAENELLVREASLP